MIMKFHGCLVHKTSLTSPGFLIRERMFGLCAIKCGLIDICLPMASVERVRHLIGGHMQRWYCNTLPLKPLYCITNVICLFWVNCLRTMNTVSLRFFDVGYPQPGLAPLSKGCGLWCMLHLLRPTGESWLPVGNQRWKFSQRTRQTTNAEVLPVSSTLYIP